MSGSSTAGDEVMLQRATRALAIRAAALVAVAMLVLMSLVALVVVRGQQSATDRLLRTAAATADDVGDPPPGAWLVLARAGRLSSSPGLPASLDLRLASLRGAARSQLQLSDVRSGARSASYRVATQRRVAGTVQVVKDLRGDQADRQRLLKTMAAASLLGLVLAAAFGALLGRRAVRPLADALELQRTFVADASHELRTPLTLLSTRAQLLDRALARGPVDEQARLDSAGVVADVQRLREVLDDLLVAADPTGQTPVVVLRLESLVVAAVDSARAHAETAAVALHLSTGAAGKGGSTQVLGAPTALRRALLSLIDNAIDHTPAGGAVTVIVRPGRRRVILQVSDTGPGIDPAAAKDIMRRFHSGGQRAGRAHYGLGLALSNDIVNRHGGELKLVHSSQGATFEISLPVSAERRAERD